MKFINNILEWFIMKVVLGDPMGGTKPYYWHDRIILKYQNWKRNKK